MRRLFSIATLATLLVAIAAFAQHGGGGHAGGGGGHAGFSGGGFGGGHSGFGGHMGSIGGGHAFSGSHSFSSPHSFSGARSSTFSARPFSRGSSFARGSFRGNHFGTRTRTYRYSSHCYGCGWGWGWGWGWGYPYYYPYLGGGIDPYWWWEGDSSDSGYGPAYAYDQAYADNPVYSHNPRYDYNEEPQYQSGLNNQMNDQGIVPWRSRKDQRAYSQQSQTGTTTLETTLATVLVFRDQHKEEVKNYAIVGQTLWNFAPQHTEKIPLSELDIPATEKANDERGVSFHVPGTGEGQ